MTGRVVRQVASRKEIYGLYTDDKKIDVLNSLEMFNSKQVFGCLVVFMCLMLITFTCFKRWYVEEYSLDDLTLDFTSISDRTLSHEEKPRTNVSESKGFENSSKINGSSETPVKRTKVEEKQTKNLTSLRKLDSDKLLRVGDLKSSDKTDISDKRKVSNTSTEKDTKTADEGVQKNPKAKPKSENLLTLSHFVRCPNPIGRLGNMMFQLAAVIGLAHSLNFIPVINVSHPLVKLFEMENIRHVSDLHLTNIKAVGQMKWLSEKKEIYLQHNLTVSGYLQSWRFFHNASGAVRKAFSVKSVYLERAKSFLSANVNGSKTIVGIHVRRGDYLQPEKQKRGRVVADTNYMAKAMIFYRQLYKDVYFVVCSDDLKWCKENIKGSDVVYSGFKEPILDLAIMSLCHHMIITGGTFGWWGGWLSGGTVVYLEDFPLVGSALAKILSKEKYYPPHWIGMSIR